MAPSRWPRGSYTVHVLSVMDVERCVTLEATDWGLYLFFFFWGAGQSRWELRVGPTFSGPLAGTWGKGGSFIGFSRDQCSFTVPLNPNITHQPCVSASSVYRRPNMMGLVVLPLLCGPGPDWYMIALDETKTYCTDIGGDLSKLAQKWSSRS